MARPKKERFVYQPPMHSSFKPTGVMKKGLRRQVLTLDEYEAIRLADYSGLDHEEAAKEMEVSRSTFTRMLEHARHKLSEFLVEGCELYIEGGNIHFRENIMKCSECGRIFNTSFGTEMVSCPACGSTSLVDLAGSFGHGACCRKRYGNEGGHGHGRNSGLGFGRRL